MGINRRLREGETFLRMGNGARVAAKAVGDVTLLLNNDFKLMLRDVLFVPELVKNIISISMLDKDGFSCLFSKGVCNIYKNECLVGTGELENNLYTLKLKDIPLNNVQAITTTNKRKQDTLNSAQLWHARLGHISIRRMNKLVGVGMFDMSDINALTTCESCLKGKMTKIPFKGHAERAKGLLDLIHTDVCGPLSITTKHGHAYFITFTDDFSRYGYVYLMKYKCEAFERFKKLIC